MKILSKTGKTINIAPDVMEEFSAKIGGRIVTANQNNYDAVRQIWNGMHDKKPALIAQCSGVADVIASVNLARKYELLTSIRGGGHNVAGNASNDGGFIIDLSPMKGIRVDLQTQTVHAQAGCTLGDLDRETQVFNLVAPAGVVSTTGIAGLTLGGGIGWLRKKHGLSIDNLVSVDIVTATGDFLTASAKQNTDLFWALRGGGGNFGVVTSFEYQLHPVGPMVYFCAPFYPAEEADKILPFWREFMDNSPDEVSSNASFWTIPAVPDFPEQIHGKRFLGLFTAYCGSPEEGEKILKPLRTLSTPLVDLSSTMPWTMLQKMFDPFFPTGQQNYYFKSKYLDNLNEDTIKALIPKSINPPQPMILIAMWHIGGKMSRISESATPFAGRQNTCLFSIDAVWSDDSANAEVVKYVNDYLNDLNAYTKGGMYVNFAGLGEEGESIVKAAYGENYQRLVEIKTKYDPGNLFRMNQNIKPKDV